MARRLELGGTWMLEGFFRETLDIAAIPATVPGHVAHDLARAGLLPDINKNENAHRLCEWIEHRRWRYKTQFDLPKEGSDGSSEKFFLDLPKMNCGGILNINGAFFVFNKSDERKRFDITASVKETENSLSITFNSDELSPILRKPGFISPIGLGRVKLICTSFLSIEDISAEISEDAAHVTARIASLARGNYTFKYRVFLGDKLLSTKNELKKLLACEQRITCELPLPIGAAGYTLRLSVERGGLGCDSVIETIRSKPKLPAKALRVDHEKYDTQRFTFDRWREYLLCALSAGANAVIIDIDANDAFFEAAEDLGLSVFQRNCGEPDHRIEDLGYIIESGDPKRAELIRHINGRSVKVALKKDELHASFETSGMVIFEIRAYDKIGREMFSTRISGIAKDGKAEGILRIPNMCLERLSCVIVKANGNAAGELVLIQPPKSDIAVTSNQTSITFENKSGFVRMIEHKEEDGIFALDRMLIMPYEKLSAPLYSINTINIKKAGSI